MQIKSLRYFVELAKAGSLYAAAKNLLISQQGLSKAVSALEDELGLTLVNRSSRGVRLTREGEVLLSHAQAISAQYDAMVAELYASSRAQGNPDERIMVHVSYYSAQIAAFDQDYIKELAGSTAYIEEPFDKLLMRAAASNGVDLVFLDAHPYSVAKIKDNSNVVFDSMFTTRYGVVWKEGSSLAAHQTIHLEDVCHLPWAVNANREIGQLAEHIFEGFSPLDVTMGTTNLPMLLEYVQLSENGAVALFDSFSFYLAQKYSPEQTVGLYFTPLSTPRALVEVGFLYPRNAKLSLRAQTLTERFRNFLHRSYNGFTQ